MSERPESLAFQVRPVPFAIGGVTHAVSAGAAQAVFKEINRLAKGSYPFAGATRDQIDRALRDGVRVRLTEEQARTVMVAIERIRVRSGRLPADLDRLRHALLNAPQTGRLTAA